MIHVSRVGVAVAALGPDRALRCLVLVGTAGAGPAGARAFEQRGGPAGQWASVARLHNNLPKRAPWRPLRLFSLPLGLLLAATAAACLLLLMLLLPLLRQLLGDLAAAACCVCLALLLLLLLAGGCLHCSSIHLLFSPVYRCLRCRRMQPSWVSFACVCHARR